MMREYHVRICDGLGVKFPGPVRQKKTGHSVRFEMTDGFAAGRVIGEWIDFYNTGRPHSALDGATPREAYRAGRPVDMMDKARALPTSPQALQQQKAFNTNVSLAA